MGAQLVATALAGKYHRRVPSLHCGLLGARADHDQFCAWLRFRNRVKGRHQHRQIFLGCDSSHVNDAQVVSRQAPLFAQDLAALKRRELLDIDAARHHAELFEAAGLKLTLQGGSRHHRAVRAVMELAQVSHDWLVEPADAVMTAVGMEVGAKVGTDRQFQMDCRLQGRPAECAFGCDMHDVRATQ